MNTMKTLFELYWRAEIAVELFASCTQGGSRNALFSSTIFESERSWDRCTGPTENAYFLGVIFLAWRRPPNFRFLRLGFTGCHANSVALVQETICGVSFADHPVCEFSAIFAKFASITNVMYFLRRCHVLVSMSSVNVNYSMYTVSGRCGALS